METSSTCPRGPPAPAQGATTSLLQSASLLLPHLQAHADPASSPPSPRVVKVRPTKRMDFFTLSDKKLDRYTNLFRNRDTER